MSLEEEDRELARKWASKFYGNMEVRETIDLESQQRIIARNNEIDKDLKDFHDRVEAAKQSEFEYQKRLDENRIEAARLQRLAEEQERERRSKFRIQDEYQVWH